MTKSLLLIFLLQGVHFCFGQTKAEKKAVEQINILLKIQTQADYEGISLEERKVAKNLSYTPAEAIPLLIPLLKHPKYQIRKRAGYAIFEIGNIDSIYLPQVSEALVEGNLWVAYAVARIGNRAALLSLFKTLELFPQTESVLTHAIIKTGIKSEPYLLSYLKNAEKCDYQFMRCIQYIYENSDSGTNFDFKKLEQIILDANYNKKTKYWAIACLGAIGPRAAAADKSLILLLSTDYGPFNQQVINALFRIKSPFSAELLLNEIENPPDPIERKYLMRSISELGPLAKPSGARIMKYLATQDWDLKVSVVRTIGLINYQIAIPEIIELSGCEQDWRLAYASIQALADLNATEAIPHLKSIAKTHWNKEVRKFAKIIFSKLKRPKNKNNKFNKYYNLNFFTYGSKKFRIMQRICVFPNFNQKINHNKGTITTEYQGEFGGNITFTDSIGKKIIIDGICVKSIHTWNNKIIVLTGLNHLGSDDGEVYEMKLTKDSFELNQILTLPSSPKGIRVHRKHIKVICKQQSLKISKDFKISSACHL